MNREEIKTYLPHREPMLLIDSVERLSEDKAVGEYTVRGDEWFVQGHFPGNPVVPGVVLCEIMAQACSILIGEKLKGKTPFFAGIEKARFKNPVHPGDTLKIECTLSRVREPFYFTEAKGSVNGKLSVTGQFSFALVSP